ncbi:unnamed protein product [Brassica rapa]|uniref:Uncharacterized protein n=1 Tax=Brassica campestris TaxID=3711 RepID=A0A8D9DM18_BRACM|nr:unnamed protein product [Brassica rapa]
MDCSGDFGPRGLSVQTSLGVRQNTHDVRSCPSAHTGRQWMSLCVCVCPTSVIVCVCPSAHTGRPWVSVSTHMTTSVVVHQYTYQHVGPWTQHPGPSRGLFGRFCPTTHRTSVGVRQHTQDVRGCLWLSVSTHRTSVAVRVCPTHMTSLCVRQHTQDVRGCPCVSVCIRQHTQDVRALHTGRPWVSVSTHMTSLCVRQHTQDVRGCPCVSVCIRQHTQDVRACPSLHISARGLCVQYTQDVCGCPPAHTGRQWLTSVAVHVCLCVSVSTQRTSVAVHQYTYQHVGPWTQHPGPSRGLTHRTSVGVRQHTQDVRGCLWLSVSTHRTSVADVRGCPCVSVCIRQHTQDVRGCPSVHISACWSLDSTR